MKIYPLLLVVFSFAVPTVAQLPRVDYAAMFFQTASTATPIRKVWALPATCTTAGAVGSTNAVLYQGRVYQCIATNTWAFAVGQTAALTATRIPYAGSNGELTDSTLLRFESSILKSNQVVIGSGYFAVAPPAAGLVVEGAINVGGTNSSYKIFSLDVPTVTSGSRFGIGSRLVASSSGASSHTNYAVYGSSEIIAGNAQNYTGLFSGIVATVNHSGTGTLSTAEGGHFDVTAASSGGVTTARGFYSKIINTGSGTVTNGYGVFVDTPANTGGGAITTNYGVYIANQTGAGTNYAIYTAGGTNYFTGNIQSAGTTFGSLGTPANGTLIYCTDCTIANPCASGGTGALAKRLNGVWVCN